MTYFFRREQASIDNISEYIGEPGVFQLFSKQVVIEKKQSYFESSSTKIERALPKANEKLGIKIIRPLKRICEKYFEANRGICQVHIHFIKYVIQYRVYKEAVSIISRKQLPSKNIAEHLLQYFYNAFIIFFELKKYKAAQQALNHILEKSIREELKNTHYDILLSLLLIARISKKNLTQVKDTISNVIEDTKFMKFSSSSESQTSPQKIHLLQALLSEKVITPEQQKYMIIVASNFNKKLLISANSKSLKMLHTVREHIEDSYERIRTEDINQQPLNSLSNMQRINQYEPLCKYNCEEHILYFNHCKYTEEQLNNMVTDCFKMHEIVKYKQEADKISQMGGGFSGFGALRGY